MNPNDWLCVVPHLAPRWNLEQFLMSCGEITVPFLLIDNSPNSDTLNMDIPKGIEVLRYPDNLGVPMSWNMGIVRGAKWTQILSVSTRFGEGGLKRYLDGAAEVANEYGFHSPIGGHCHARGRELIRKIGLADGNYSPGYKEDSQWGHAMRVLDIEKDMVWYRPVGLHIVGSAIAIRSGVIGDQRIKEREAYYLARNGGTEGRETFIHPFNNPELPIQYWPQPERFQNRGLPEWTDYLK